MKPYGTAIFVGTCALFWSYLYFYLPETKGRNVEDITAEFRKRTGEGGRSQTQKEDQQ